MPRDRITPFQQGQIDHLCGLYAIVNACRWGLKDASPLSRADSVELLTELAYALETAGRFAEIYAYGMTIPDLSRSLKTAKRWFQERYGQDISIRKPFHSIGSVGIHRLAADITRNVQRPNTAVIIGTTGRADHWTVVTAVNTKTFSLCDSNGRNWFRRKKCLCGPMSADHTDALRLVPSSMFILTFTETRFGLA